MKRVRLAFRVLFLLAGLGACGGSGSEPGSPSSPGLPAATPAPPPASYGGAAVPRAFVRRVGARLVRGDDDVEARLQGVCFGNQVWGNPSDVPWSHHAEVDLDRTRDMGMNAARFYLNHALLDSGAAWEWIDLNVEWARARGIVLILNMHVPPGGFQSLGEGLALWQSTTHQDHLRRLWRQIAERYRDEPVIAGYDLVNEPIVPDSIDQWQEVAESLVREIRSVDTNHLIFVERLNGVAGQWETYGRLNFLDLSDAGIVHELHFYSPIEYTHQNASWTDFGDGGRYPDPNVIAVPADLTWSTTTHENPPLPAGDSGWRHYEGVRFRVDDPTTIVAKPVVGSDLNAGTAYFDDIQVTEYDEGGRPRNLLQLNVASLDGWSYWSNDGSGQMLLAPEGHGDGASIAIQGTTDWANAANNSLRFPVLTGRSYQISGWMKGRGVTGSGARLRIDFEASPSGSPLHRRDKAYLQSLLAPYVAWGAARGVPLYVGELGLYKDCYENGKGGLRWAEDVIDILQANGLHFTWHAYHEGAFGIYQNDVGLPDPAQANDPLIALFRSTLR
jgi:endoglucanase